MIDVVKKFFNKSTAEVSGGANQNTAHDIRVATCALFVEIARIDEKFTDAEMESIITILKEKYGLSPDHANALIAEAERELMALRKEQEPVAPPPEPEEAADIDDDDPPDGGAPPKSVFRLMPWMKLK